MWDNKATTSLTFTAHQNPGLVKITRCYMQWLRSSIQLPGENESAVKLIHVEPELAGNENLFAVSAKAHILKTTTAGVVKTAGRIVETVSGGVRILKLQGSH